MKGLIIVILQNSDFATGFRLFAADVQFVNPWQYLQFIESQDRNGLLISIRIQKKGWGKRVKYEFAFACCDPDSPYGYTAWQSSTAWEGTEAYKAIDENTNTDYNGGSCTHTTWEHKPWLAIDLGAAAAQKKLSSVTIFNRADCCSGKCTMECFGDSRMAVRVLFRIGLHSLALSKASNRVACCGLVQLISAQQVKMGWPGLAYIGWQGIKGERVAASVRFLDRNFEYAVRA